MTTNELERLGLTGRTIQQLFIGPGEEDLLLRTDDGDLRWTTDADCCSETWFADIIGVKNLLGYQVVAASEENLDDPDDGRTRQDVDTLTVLTVSTVAGESKIHWRNSSNGYYGGSVYLVGTEPRWYTRSSEVKIEEMTEITADWRAGEGRQDRLI